MIERVVGIGLVKEINETLNDGIDVEDGLPVFTEDVETDLALEVDVRMVDSGLAVDLGRGMGVVVRDCECELICGALPEAGVGSNTDVEGGEVVGIREVDFGNLSSIELGNICISGHAMQ